MQAIRVKEGQEAPYTPAGSDTDAGKVVIQGTLVGIASTTIPNGVLGALDIEGTFDVQKCSVAFIKGAPVYWSTTLKSISGATGAATPIKASNTFMGWAIRTAALDDTTVRVKLVLTPSTTQVNRGGLQNPIADAADGAAIAVTNSGYVPLVTAGVETRTIAAPTYIGQEMLLYFKTKVGNCTITVASTVNDAGDTTITFTAAGQMVLLTAGEADAAKVWRETSDIDTLTS